MNSEINKPVPAPPLMLLPNTPAATPPPLPKQSILDRFSPDSTRNRNPSDEPTQNQSPKPNFKHQVHFDFLLNCT